MANTTEQDLNIIKQYDTKEIIMAMLKTMDGYHGLPFISYTRSELEKCWNDFLWWPNKEMVETVTKLFRRVSKNQSRWSGGGSWSPEGGYLVDVYQCRLCNSLEEIQVPDPQEDYSHEWTVDLMNPMHSHMSRCKKVRKIQDDSGSLEEFKYKLLREV